MLRKIKYSKITIVVFLTVLIWVWTDLALDDRLTVSNVTLSVAKSTNPNLWVSFNQERSFSLDNIVLKGPVSKIAELSREINNNSLKLDFSFYPEWEGMTTAGLHTITVRDIIKKSEEMREFSSLSVESCEPETIDVNVVELLKKPVTVQCIDESGKPLKTESIDPQEVQTLVPGYWLRDKLKAQVKLELSEIEKARSVAIEKRPYVELATGQTREVATTVKIKLPSEEYPLNEERITATTLSIALSPTLLDEYRVEVTNLPQVLNPIDIRATPEAKRRYEMQKWPLMTLYIFDDDTKKGQEEQRREVIYNFPPEFVSQGQIELKNPEQPAEARFKLIHLPSAESP